MHTKIVGNRTFRGTGTTCGISNIKQHLNDNMTLADTAQCLTDRVTIRSSTNAVLWSQMRILVKKKSNMFYLRQYKFLT
jgi:hypothetical protein